MLAYAMLSCSTVHPELSYKNIWYIPSGTTSCGNVERTEIGTIFENEWQITVSRTILPKQRSEILPMNWRKLTKEGNDRVHYYFCLWETETEGDTFISVEEGSENGGFLS